MKKTTSRTLILVLIAVAVIFVVFDFVRDSSKEEAAREVASQQEETEFTQRDELEQDTAPSEADSNVVASPKFSYGASPGQLPYDFELINMETDEIVKISDFKGQKVFLNFWASWCPPCKVEAPHLQRFSENQDEVVVLGVNVTTSESSIQNAQDFIDEYQLTFTNVYGVEEMFAPFFVESLPTSYFIDSNGIIQERVIGPVTEDVLNAHFSMID